MEKHWAVRIPWVILLVSVVSLIVVSDALPTVSGRFRVGMVSTSDIVASRRVTYTSEVRTKREQDAAAARVERVYTVPDRSQAVQQRAIAFAVVDFVDAVRQDPFASRQRKSEMVSAMSKVTLSPAVISMTLTLTEPQWRAVVTESLRVLDSTMRREIREGQLGQVRRTIPNQIDVGLNEQQALVVTELVGGLVVANSFLDVERTETTLQQARDQVPPSEQVYEAGQIIVRRGDVVTVEQMEALEALGLQSSVIDWRRIGGHSLLMALLISTLSLYIQRLHPRIWDNPRLAPTVVALVSGMALLAKVLVPIGGSWSYLVPVPAVAMVLSVLLVSDLAVMMAVVLALMVGVIGGSLELAIYTFVGSALAALVLHHVDQLHDFLRAGLLVGVANCGVIAAFVLADASRSWVDIFALSAVGLINGGLSASLTLVGFYLLSNFLGITTFLQLMELARPTNPLFKELLLKAPGTYHHSIIVSNLAERAAEAIGADPLLVRVGAYYHDVGKTLNPHFFVENQANGHNPHHDLNDPVASARIIVDHVMEGVRLARKHHLPPRIIDFICEHHGTTSVSYFYHQACERYGKEAVSLPMFSYEGPRPQSREAAILLLADTIEAATRANRPAGAVEIDELVRKLIGKKLNEGQLDQCDITLRDLEQIRQAFVDVLQGIYHPRVQYPGDEANRVAAPAASARFALEGATHHDQRSTPDRRVVGTTS